MSGDPRVVLAEMRERVDAFPQSVKGKPWVHPCVDLAATLDAVEAVLGMCDKADTKPIDGARQVNTAVLRSAITDALGGA